MNKMVEYSAIMGVHSAALATMDLTPEEQQIVKDLAGAEVSRVKKSEFVDMLALPTATAQLAIATGALESVRVQTALSGYRSGLKEKAPQAGKEFDGGIVDIRKEIVKRAANFKLEETGITELVERLFDIVDRDKSGTLDQTEVAATAQLLQKWSEMGKPGWDSPTNLTEMLEPAWLLLAGSTKDKVTLHSVLKLVSIVLECVVKTSRSVQDVWAESVPVGVPKVSKGVFEIFAASGYDLDKNKTLSFDEAIEALEKMGILAEMDANLAAGKEEKKKLEEKIKEEGDKAMTDLDSDEGMFGTVAKNLMDAQSVEKIVPKVKAHLEMMKSTSPAAMSVFKSFINGGITEEVFIDHVQKATAETAGQGEDMAQGILDDVILPSIRGTNQVSDKAAVEALVAQATAAFNALKLKMVAENDRLIIDLAKACFALVDINQDGTISMSEIDTFKKLNMGDDENMDAKKIVTTLLSIMDKDGNKEIDAEELEKMLLRVYKFMSITVFGLQRYTSMWLCKILADPEFAVILQESAKLAAKEKGTEDMQKLSADLSKGVTIPEAIQVYEFTKNKEM